MNEVFRPHGSQEPLAQINEADYFKLKPRKFDYPLQWNWNGYDYHPGGQPDLSRPEQMILEFDILSHTGMTFNRMIPKTSVIASIVGEAKRLTMEPDLPGTDWARCPDPARSAGGDCDIGWCRWEGHPAMDERRSDGRIISWYFHNRSHDYHVSARMRIFFYHSK